MLDYEGLFLVELKAISDGCERLVPSPESWGSPLSLAAPESMRKTTNRRYHCTLQTTKTSSVWEGNNNPQFSIDFSTRAKGKALALRKLYMLEMQWICINVHITSVTFVWLNFGESANPGVDAVVVTIISFIGTDNWSFSTKDRINVSTVAFICSKCVRVEIRLWRSLLAFQYHEDAYCCCNLIFQTLFLSVTLPQLDRTSSHYKERMWDVYWFNTHTHTHTLTNTHIFLELRG